jgi:hypothetical protein
LTSKDSSGKITKGIAPNSGINKLFNASELAVLNSQVDSLAAQIIKNGQKDQFLKDPAGFVVKKINKTSTHKYDCNDLPIGKAVFAKNMELGALQSENPQLERIHTDPKDHKKGKKVLMCSALALGTAALRRIPGGGSSASTLMLYSALFGAAHGGETLRNMHTRGEEIFSWNSNVVHAWFELGGSAFGGMGIGGAKIAQMMPKVSNASRAIAGGAAVTSTAGFVIDNAAMGYIGKELFQNWENL